MQNYVENALISDLEELQYVRHLPGLKKLSHVQLELVTDLSAVLAGLPPISRLWLSGAIEAIEGLVEHSASLKDLTLWSGASIGDLTQLTRLRNLEHLAIGHSGRLNNLDHLEGLSALKELWLVDCDDIRDFTPLTELPHLELLRFDRFVPDSAWAVIPRLRSLTALEFVGQGHLPGGLLGIATAQPNLSRLVLLNLDWLESVDGIANLECLESLMIEGGNIREIGELSRLSKLKTLQLYCPLVTDLAPLAEIPTLRDLFIDRGMAQVDLSSLRDCTMTIHLWRESEVRRWRPKMGKGIKFASLGRRWR
jgi:Leucine-rich repeat (LRR) protein